MIEVFTVLLIYLATSECEWGGKPRYVGGNKTVNSDFMGGRRGCGAVAIVRKDLSAIVAVK
jgi:hypothetical protein